MNTNAANPQSNPRPETNIQTNFETGNRDRLDPCSSFEHLAHDTVVDAALPGHLAQASSANSGSQVQSDLTHDLGSWVGAGFGQPVVSGVAGRVALGSSHEASLCESVDLPIATCGTENLELRLTSVTGVSYSQREEDELAVAKKIESYTPKVDPADWAHIETFVREAVRDAEPDRYSTAQPWLSCVAQLVMWSWKVECLPLDRAVVFEPANIFAFVEQRTGLKDASQATTRAILLNISTRLLGENAGATEDRRTYANRAGRTPYSAAEKIALRSFIRGQGTAHRRRNVRVIIALGAGAGLTAVDLMVLKPEHIEDQGDKILIHVPGSKARTVPLIAEWEDLLRDSLVSADPAMPLVLSTRGKFRYGNAIADFLYSCNDAGVRPHCQRLRSTWFVDHLNAGTPVNVLLAAAGVTEVSTLGRYLKFLAPIGVEASTEFLRLGASS